MNPILCKSIGLTECFLRFSLMSAKSYDNVWSFIWPMQLNLNVKVLLWHLSKVSPVIKKNPPIFFCLFVCCFFLFVFLTSHLFFFFFFGHFTGLHKKNSPFTLKVLWPITIGQALFWYYADEDLETCFSIDWLRVVQAKWSSELLPIFQFHKSQNILYINWTLNANMDWH